MRARIIHGVVLAALTATAVAWVSLDKSVTVEVDGQSRVVLTHASTVAEVLERADIRVDLHDLVAPAGSTRISDGSHIVIKRGRLVQVRVNEVERGVWVNASDVSQVLAEIGIGTDDRTYLSASRSSRVPSTGAFSLQVRIPSQVQLVVEGNSRTISTTAPTVAELLVAEGVTLTSNDDVSVPLASYPTDGLTIVVTDRRGVRVSRTRPIPVKTRTRRDGAVPAGTTRVISAGAPGVLVLYFRALQVRGVTVTVPDGLRIARPARDRVIIVGTAKRRIAQPAASKPKPKPLAPQPAKKKPAAVRAPVRTQAPTLRKPAPATAAAPPKTPAHKPAADKLNWAAVAACESGNNPRAVSAGGVYRGLYQFMLATWRGVGGVGDPIDASPDEQTYRAQLLYREVGASAWPTCGPRLLS